ncbi:MAG: hypothetical protein GY774_14735, partial [Planctomycetes bacterium]|nr:hypothetical protein [Planctomycetota bacterium]
IYCVIDLLVNDDIFGVAYIDDLAGADKTKERAQKSYETCAKRLSELGLVQATKKASPPSQCMVWLGICFDTSTMQMSIPRKKILQIHALVVNWCGKKSCTKSQLRKLLGKLFFAATCCGPLRLFCNRLLAAYRSNKGEGHMKLDSEFHRELEWISKFLLTFNGIDVIEKLPTCKHVLYVDSCLKGAGGHLGRDWYYIIFSRAFVSRELDISILEMANAVAAIKHFANRLAGHVVVLKCDNSASVSVLATGKGHCPTLLRFARSAWEVTAHHAIVVQVQHVAGSENQLADELSRVFRSPQAMSSLLDKARSLSASVTCLNESVLL